MAIFAPILGAFGKTKVTQRNYSDAVQNAITGSANQVAADRTASQGDLQRYTDAIGRASGRLEGMLPEDSATLGRVINETAGADPMNQYRAIGDYQMGLMDRFSKGLADQGRKGQNLQFARMGYGGRGGSTYTNNAMLDRISQNLAPAFASTAGNIGRDTQIVGNQRLAQGGQVANLINSRRGLVTQGADLLLNPANARANLSDAEANRLGTLGNAARTTTAGFEAKKDFVGRLADGLSESEDTILDTALSVLSMYTGGGMGGMMGGGGGGGGKAGGGSASNQRPPPNTFTPSYAPQVNFGSSGGYLPSGQGVSPFGATQQYSPQLQAMLQGGNYGVAPMSYEYRPQF